MKKSLKKMTLSRETLRHLSAEQIRRAGGGLQEDDTTTIFQPPPLTGDSKRVCCV